MNSASRKLGELLVDRRLVSKDTLEQLLVRETEIGVPVARLLVEEGHVREEDLLRAIAERVGMDFVELDDELFEPDAVGKLPEETARSLTSIPLRVQGPGLVVAVADPFDPDAHHKLEKITAMPVKLVLATKAAIVRAIDFVHGPRQPDLKVVAADGSVQYQGASSDTLVEDGTHINDLLITRSEERRVGKEGRSRWSPDH